MQLLNWFHRRILWNWWDSYLACDTLLWQHSTRDLANRFFQPFKMRLVLLMQKHSKTLNSPHWGRGKWYTKSCRTHSLTITKMCNVFRYQLLHKYDMSKQRDLFRSNRWLYMLMYARIHWNVLWNKWDWFSIYRHVLNWNELSSEFLYDASNIFIEPTNTNCFLESFSKHTFSLNISMVDKRYVIFQISMTVLTTRVRTTLRVSIKLIITHVLAWLDSLEYSVKQVNEFNVDIEILLRMNVAK